MELVIGLLQKQDREKLARKYVSYEDRAKELIEAVKLEFDLGHGNRHRVTAEVSATDICGYICRCPKCRHQWMSEE